MENEIKTQDEIYEEVVNLPVIEPDQKGTDLTEFEGNKATIEKVMVIDTFSSYNEEGKFEEGLKRPVKKLKAITSVVTQIETKDGKIDIRASELFGLANKMGMWGISSHPKAGIQKFMVRQKVQKPEQLVGTKVTVKAVENKDGRTFLGFITE